MGMKVYLISKGGQKGGAYHSDPGKIHGWKMSRVSVLAQNKS